MSLQKQWSWSQRQEVSLQMPTQISTTTLSSNYLKEITRQAIVDDMDQDLDGLQIFWNLTTKCILYIKRQQERLNQTDYDQLIFQMFKPHFDMQKLLPQPISDVGNLLKENGYVLCAFAIMRARMRNNKSLLSFFRSVYQDLNVKIGKNDLFFHIRDNQQEAVKRQGSTLQSIRRQNYKQNQRLSQKRES